MAELDIRACFKNKCPKGHVGSSPTFGSKKYKMDLIMEKQNLIETKCKDCNCKLIVPTITDWEQTIQIGPATCICGWKQSGRFIRNGGGFIADRPVGYGTVAGGSYDNYED